MIYVYIGDMMDLLKLKYFYIVAKIEHVTKAAEEIHIAQPALTKSIKLLEQDLGVKLFRREGRNVALTEYGKFLKNKLDGIFPILDGLPDEIERMKNTEDYTIKLNILAASTAVMDAVVKFKKKYPEVIFNIIQNNEKPNCNVSVTTNYGFSFKDTTTRRCIMEEKIYLAVPKNSKYGNLESIDLSLVSNEKFVNLAGSRPFRMICDKFCSYAGFVPQIAFESDSPIAVKNIIGADAGIGFWPEYSWGKLKSNDVVLLPISNPVCQREIIVDLHSFSNSSKYVEIFYEHLVSCLHKKQNA